MYPDMYGQVARRRKRLGAEVARVWLLTVVGSLMNFQLCFDWETCRRVEKLKYN